MKLDIKDLERALELLKAEGVTLVDLKLDTVAAINRLVIAYDTKYQNRAVLSLAEYKSGGFNTVTETRTF